MDIINFLTVLGLGGIIGSVITNYLEKKKFIFENIHQDRVKALIEMYRKITMTERAFQSLMNPAQWIGEPSQEEKQKKAAEVANEFVEYFHDNKIYLGDNTEVKINYINEELINSWARYNYTVKFGGNINPKEWVEVWKKIKEEIPNISREVKKEFQQIIGIE